MGKIYMRVCKEYLIKKLNLYDGYTERNGKHYVTLTIEELPTPNERGMDLIGYFNKKTYEPIIFGQTQKTQNEFFRQYEGYKETQQHIEQNKQQINNKKNG